MSINIKLSGMIDYYLAVPYNHKDSEVRQYRFEQITKLAGYLINKGYIVYSPITHNHIVALTCNLKLGFDFWSKSDLTFLKMSKNMAVLQLDGWGESKGVHAEISFALKNNIKIIYYDDKFTPIGGAI